MLQDPTATTRLKQTFGKEHENPKVVLSQRLNATFSTTRGKSLFYAQISLKPGYLKLLVLERCLVFQEKSDDRVSVDLFVNHKSKNSHHGGTSVVQFDGTLSEFL